MDRKLYFDMRKGLHRKISFCYLIKSRIKPYIVLHNGEDIGAKLAILHRFTSSTYSSGLVSGKGRLQGMVWLTTSETAVPGLGLLYPTSHPGHRCKRIHRTGWFPQALANQAAIQVTSLVGRLHGTVSMLTSGRFVCDSKCVISKHISIIF